MATQVNYTLSKSKEFEISSIEDFGNMIKKNLKEYREHLKQVNICIIMFEELETNRTWEEMVTDWVDGARSGINGERLIMHLKKLKEEILNGIRCYLKLLIKKDQLKTKLDRLDSISTSSLDVKKKECEEVSYMKLGGVAKCAVGGTLVGAGVGAIACSQSATIAGMTSAILLKCGFVSASISKFLLIGATGAAGGIIGGIVVASVIKTIYDLAKQHGEKRGLEYQRIKNLNDALGPDFLASIRTNHAYFKELFETIDESLNTNEKFKLEAMKKFYSNNVQKFFQKLKSEKSMGDELRKSMAKHMARLESENFLKTNLEISDEEAKEFMNTIENGFLFTF